jgi:hypothetical protein
VFAAIAPLAASEFKKNFVKPIITMLCGYNKDAVMHELPSPTTEIACETPLSPDFTKDFAGKNSKNSKMVSKSSHAGVHTRTH